MQPSSGPLRTPDSAASTPPHSFRARGIANFLENRGTLEVAQRIAGHADSQTTKSFYEPPRGEKFSSKIGLVGLAYGVWTNHTSKVERQRLRSLFLRGLKLMLKRTTRTTRRLSPKTRFFPVKLLSRRLDMAIKLNCISFGYLYDFQKIVF